jgi:hypothetical protein
VLYRSRSILLTALLSLLLAVPQLAQARAGCFGKGEKLYYVAPVSLTAPGDVKLDLARKYTHWCLLFPVAQHDDGYVLRSRNNLAEYFNLPGEADVKKMQEAGLLPNPLPDWEQSWVYLIFDGYFFWVMVLAIVVYVAYTIRKFKRERAAA